jgi:hypothetical protein
MIYLIDDNILRQKDSGWNDNRFEEYKSEIYPIYKLSEITPELKDELFKNENNVILFHESFFDNSENKQNKDVNEIRNSFVKFSNATTNRYFVNFSGSNSERKLNEDNTSASLPVHILYSNLELFIKQYQSEKKYNLKFLLYGININIEQHLLDQLKSSKQHFIEENQELSPELNSFFYFRSRHDINLPISNSLTILNNDTQESLEIKIAEQFSNSEFEGIFIPISFGQTLSDFNGLRLATNIRCTESQNQLKPIFIYSFVEVQFLLENEYFNILKTKNVFLINYTKKAFNEAINIEFTPFLKTELSTEIKKLNLQTPKNYIDNHSITNEWAIQQWAKTIDCGITDQMEKVLENVKSNIFFKYLKTIHPIDNIDIIPAQELKINYVGKPKVLIIDDEINKGWDEIFVNILYDINKIDVHYLGEDFINQNQEEIIQASIDKINENDIDVVVLDFRLNSSDFEIKKIDEITSVKLLKRIKEMNRGIQVIAFSATNKVWNVKQLEIAEIDGFISKGDPNYNEQQHTNRLIKELIQKFEDTFTLTFLKQFYRDQNEIKIDLTARKNVNHINVLPKRFVEEVLKWLELSNNILIKGKLNDDKIASSFIFKFSILENIANRVIDVDNSISVGKNEYGQNKYQYEFRTANKNLISFIEDPNQPGYYKKTNEVFITNRNLPWIIKILNTIDFITDEKLKEDKLTRLIKKRNDFIHANSTTSNKIHITIDDLKFLNQIITIGLKNIV